MNKNETFIRILTKIKEIEGFKRDNEVAKLLGVSKENLSRWKTRSTIPYKILQEYCRSRNISLDSLLGDKKKALMVKEPGSVYINERARVREIMKIIQDHPELDKHIYHYLQSLITKPK